MDPLLLKVLIWVGKLALVMIGLNMLNDAVKEQLRNWPKK